MLLKFEGKRRKTSLQRHMYYYTVREAGGLIFPHHREKKHLERNAVLQRIAAKKFVRMRNQFYPVRKLLITAVPRNSSTIANTRVCAIS